MISIIIPTWNNMEYLLPCIDSIARNTVGKFEIIVVNNGDKELENYLSGMEIIHTGKNLGWMGGINEGLKYAKGKYVIFMNDDTHILPHHYDWMYKLQSVLDNDETVAAVGPCSNVVAGWQNMLHKGLPSIIETKFLIGFCVMVRKNLFKEIGGMDEELPGGDDFDWSIRFRKAGFKLINNRNSFVFHHGFKTGERVHGNHLQANGWNSPEMTENTNVAIIRKHGFKEYIETARNAWKLYDTMAHEYGDHCVLNKIVSGKGIDVGCGPSKIKGSIGVDLIAKDELMTYGDGKQAASVADIKASGDDLPFDDDELDYVIARHNIEHYSNVLKTLREWHRVLKPRGKLGITTPDDAKLNGMRLDPTHKHSFDRMALRDLMETAGFKINELGGTENQWDFFIIAEKEKK